jgi:hypothetical protein
MVVEWWGSILWELRVKMLGDSSLSREELRESPKCLRIMGQELSDGWGTLTCTAKHKHACHSPEAVASPRSGIVPISETDFVAVDASRDVDDTKEEVGGKSEKFDQGKPEFRFSKALDAEHLEGQEGEPEDQKVAPLRDLVGPIHENGGDDVVFVREDGGPDDEVVPAHGHAEGFVDEAVCKTAEGTVGGIQGGHFAKGLHDAESNDADDTEADDQTRRTAG